MALRRTAGTVDVLINGYEWLCSRLLVGFAGLSVIGIAHWATVERPRRNERWRQQQADQL